ncbi:MAG TPA: NAD-dependent epimerase/dehydratase family protein [Patescibacteria group bacterium]|nr:NAD-dependent epimerase/dehydratase family protein [Patescibacteria group bacterium]
MPTEKKNILVTGGAGFIGSHLCEALLKEGHVICVDNFLTSQETNIDALLKNPDFEFIRLDVTQPIDLEAYPELARFKIKFNGLQEIYHLACPMSPKKFEQYQMQTLLANSLGMKQVLDLAVRTGARVVHVSTSTVYGPRPEDGHFFKEGELGTSDLLSPRACYDEGKRFAESCCATYAQAQKADVRIARLFRTYGPRMPLFDGQMIPDFITDALDGKDLEIYGDESFRTSMVYVSDVVDGLIKLMKTPKGIGPVNFGSDVDMPLVDVAHRIIEMTGSSSKIVFKPALLFMSQLGLPDLSKAKDKLDWIPLVTLDNGLKQTIDYTMANRALLGMRMNAS